MKDLVAAFTIFAKYSDAKYPTHCEHDKLTVCVDPNIVSADDEDALVSLGFHADYDEECFYSFRFGSC